MYSDDDYVVFLCNLRFLQCKRMCRSLCKDDPASATVFLAQSSAALTSTVCVLFYFSCFVFAFLIIHVAHAVAGVFNGFSSKDPSHRARIPSPVNVLLGGIQRNPQGSIDIEVRHRCLGVASFDWFVLCVRCLIVFVLRAARCVSSLVHVRRFDHRAAHVRAPLAVLAAGHGN